ncbi:MAG TPA: hypothetical protein RMH99_23280, partial [Sandaracinaceae bacterium LLY-WYZ-13_1]|nr:hypothetical protein [Sandaracinaceae bacterium LLY-WYZ-13_1]
MSTEAPGRGPRRRRMLWGVGAVSLAAVVSAAALVPALMSGTRGPRSSVVALWTVLGLATALAVIPLARRAVGAGKATVAAGVALGMVIPVAFAALRSWAEPLIRSHWRCGTGDVAMVMVALPLTAALVALGGGLGLWLGRRDPRGAQRLTLAALGLVLLGVLTLLGTTGTIHRTRPAPDRWAAQLPTVTTLRWGLRERAAGRAVRRVGDDVALERTCRDEQQWGERQVGCTVRLRRAPRRAGALGEPVALPPCAGDPRGPAGTAIPPSEGAVDACPERVGQMLEPGEALTVRRDDAHGLWVVTAG